MTADRFVVAAGSRATLPDVPGLEMGARVHTSDTIMRIDALPRAIVILGGGFVAAEFAHVFASFGVQVTQVVRTDRLLRSHDADVAAAFTAAARRRWTVLTHASPTEVRVGADDVEVVLGGRSVSADLVLVATGRRPNGDRLEVKATGVDVDDESGLIVVDEYQRTTAPGIFALGDICSSWQLKHVANHEMKVVKHNLAHPDAMIRSDHRFVPSAVFTEPQIAMVGLTEEQAIARGVRYVAVRHSYAGIAAGWAREDTTGFVKLLGDPDTGLLLGAHVIGPEAATVIQPLVQAMSFGQTAARRGDRPVLDPPCPPRGGRERPAEAGLIGRAGRARSTDLPGRQPPPASDTASLVPAGAATGDASAIAATADVEGPGAVGGGDETADGADDDGHAGAGDVGDPADDRPADRGAAEEHHRLDGEHPPRYSGRGEDLDDGGRRGHERDARRARRGCRPGSTKARFGAAARASMARPKPAAEPTSWRLVTSSRRAVHSAPTSEPRLSTENSTVNVPSLPPRVAVTSSGMVTEKLKANVPTIAIITSGTNSWRSPRT